MATTTMLAVWDELLYNLKRSGNDSFFSFKRLASIEFEVLQKDILKDQGRGKAVADSAGAAEAGLLASIEFEVLQKDILKDQGMNLEDT
ncbi:hypothetical protein J5N97_022581 [Dioscorea zingiberensis]|uniref:Uncharacterized protein n=1 Tax=Dioscorea zingiberensis TaxID=325984 RepID=A0A9D5CB29_9LILI|nr:hypothetical protein J5N97_022581 [Dioscorea zingiberensis]